jgi:hypothetical protein
MKDRQEMGHEAGQEAKEYTSIKARKMLDKALTRIKQALDADVIKVFCTNGIITEAGPYVDHPTRLKAAEMVIVLNDAKPAEKHNHTGSINHTGSLISDLIAAKEKAQGKS